MEQTKAPAQNINIRCDKKIWAKVGIQAIKEGTTKRDILEKALKQYLNLK